MNKLQIKGKINYSYNKKLHILDYEIIFLNDRTKNYKGSYTQKENLTHCIEINRYKLKTVEDIKKTLIHELTHMFYQVESSRPENYIDLDKKNIGNAISELFALTNQLWFKEMQKIIDNFLIVIGLNELLDKEIELAQKSKPN